MSFTVELLMLGKTSAECVRSGESKFIPVKIAVVFHVFPVLWVLMFTCWCRLSFRSGELKFIPVKIADVFPQRAVHRAAVIYVKLIITASVGVYKLLNIRINFIPHQPATHPSYPACSPYYMHPPSSFAQNWWRSEHGVYKSGLQIAVLLIWWCTPCPLKLEKVKIQ